MNNSKEYKHDDKSVGCASEAEVTGQLIRDTLSKGGYFIVKKLNTHKPPFLGVKFHDLDPMLKRLYPLHAIVVVQGGRRRSSSVDLIQSDPPLDILGRNAQPVKLEATKHLVEQERVLSVLQDELQPLFDAKTLSALSLHERTSSTSPSPEPEPEKNVHIWDSGVDWNHSKLTFRQFLHSAAEISTLSNLLDCKLYGSPGRPSFVE